VCPARRVEAAVPLLRGLVVRDPQEQEAWALLATGLDELGDRRGAVSAFRTALGLDPADVTSLRRLGHVLVDEEQWEGAEKCLRASLALDPEAGSRGSCSPFAGGAGRARPRPARLRRGPAPGSRGGGVHAHRGAVLLLLERNEEAEAALGRPCGWTRSGTRHPLPGALFANGKLAEAEQSCMPCGNAPEGARPRMLLSKVLHALGRAEEAEAELAAIESDHSDDEDVLHAVKHVRERLKAPARRLQGRPGGSFSP